MYDPNRGKLNPSELYAILHISGLCRNGDNGTRTQEVLVEYRLSIERTKGGTSQVQRDTSQIDGF